MIIPEDILFKQATNASDRKPLIIKRKEFPALIDFIVLRWRYSRSKKPYYYLFIIFTFYSFCGCSIILCVYSRDGQYFDYRDNRD